VLARIDRTCPLIVVDPALPAHSAEPMPAQKIIVSARRWRRLVELGFPGGGELAAGVRVRLAASAEDTGHGPRGGLMLVGTGPRHRLWPDQLWLTDMVDAPYAVLPRVGRLLARVDHDLEAISAPVGLRDYVGRSFDGWHRHATLVSVAHAVRALGGTARADHDAPAGQALVAS
jgi:syndecan 1